ncbi:alginate lyase family protein [Chitinophaga qingshengii]|uniref:Alginate lyase family protein n=1 Tax=Chitinophaga qingshengii TaxID=1569794 RepID=A0ABR7TNG4_9BACT|nr:alginate lyase family protein [Chitinophaga qingshengii]MBC9931093.1 alginate lyase family protein [Chitinophaga qingshengii]
MITANDMADIRQAIKDSTWKLSSWQILKDQADKFLHENVELPPRGGNWEQYYISPNGEHELKRGDQTGDWQWEHIDPVTGIKYKGDTSSLSTDLDGVVIALIHDTWSLGVLQLGLAYQISKNEKYATKAKEILLAYAKLYPKLPIRSRSKDGQVTLNGKAKIHVQNLNESIWLVNMVQGADLIWEKLDKNEQQNILNNIFYPAVQIIQDAPTEVFNIQCWKNTAIGLVGFLANDTLLIHQAINDPVSGYLTQVKKGITREGLWFERSVSYHFYTLTALCQLAQAALNNGYPIDIRPLWKMFNGPLYIATSGFVLPAFNDSRALSLHTVDYLYEWAYSHYDDNKYEPILSNPQRGKFTNVGPFFTGWALLYGKVSLPIKTADILPITSKNLPETGIGMLSKGGGKNNLTLYLKYDPYVNTHTHYDELNFGIFKGSEPVAVIAGVKNYASRLGWNWYKTTISHNSFLLNEVMQEKSEGQCLAFGRENQVDYMITRTTNAYDSICFTRTAMVLSTDLALIIDQFETSRAPQLLDIMYHQAGKWKEIPVSQPMKLPRIKGYQEISQTNIANGLQTTNLSTTLSSGREVMVSLASNAPLDIITGYGKESTTVEKVPVAIFRSKTNSIIVAWCIATNGSKVKLDIQSLNNQAGEAIPSSKAAALNIEGAQKNWRIMLNPDKLKAQLNNQFSDKEISIETITK